MSKQYFTFQFTEDQDDDYSGPYPQCRSFTNHYDYPDDSSWTSQLLDFAEFLGLIYGYDIKSKIKFEDKYGLIAHCDRAGEHSLHKDEDEDEDSAA